MDRDAAQLLLDQALETYGVPGAQVGLLRGERRLVVCAGTLGIEDATPVEPTTAFHAGSIAKSLTGLVVVDAAARGDIDLDQPCSQQGSGLWSETPRAILAQVTGRPNVLPENDEALEDFVARTAVLPLVHEPGRFSYCNAGWSALDLLLRQRTGQSFEQNAQALLGRELESGAPPHAALGHLAVPGQPVVPVPSTYSPAAAAAGSRWWSSADELLDYSRVHLGHTDQVAAAVVQAVHTPAAPLPGHTVFDSWGLGWGIWDRGEHQAFGWAGYTGGHRAFLRCFPDQDAALVVLTNSAGPLFGPPGGSALFDALLPHLLDLLEVPALPDPSYDVAELAVSELAGQYGPLGVSPATGDALVLDAAAFGAPEPIRCTRLGGNTFSTEGNPPGSTPLAFDDGLLYLGPFALPRVG